MKRKITLFVSISMLVFAQPGFSAFVTPEMARQVAANVILERASWSNPTATYAIERIQSRMAGQEVSHYVVQLLPKGFVLVAAEDNVYPVLAYSFENDFPLSNIPEHIQSWLESYDNQITYHRNQATMADSYAAQAWQAYLSTEGLQNRESDRGVSPLLISTWNQDAPYNAMCPQDPNGPGGRVYAGCVATAMAQVMYYYRHPQTGNGASSYMHSTYGLQSANYGSTTYRWNEMLNSIYTNNPAVAELLYHCGVAVKMMYSPTGSGAYSHDAATALKTYFRYGAATQLVQKDNYSDQAWKTLMRNQLDLRQPMYYHGYGSGGHAFNLDGYQGDDHFHFNWGWGGSFNGYYFLNNLNPGGSSFTNGQGAIINIVPDGSYQTGCNGQVLLTHPYGTFEDGSGPLANYGPNGFCSWLIAPQVNPEDTISSITLKFHKFQIESGFDKLNIYDGNTTSHPLIGSYSGSEAPAEITSTGNTLLITLYTNDTIEDQGFIASYSSSLPVFCKKEITVLTDSTGVFSDGSDVKNYSDRTICHWIIQPSGATVATLQFTSFDTEATHDFVDVYSYEPLTGQGTLLGRFSGSNLPPYLISQTGAFFVTFFTNPSVTAGGWTAAYGAGSVGVNERTEGNLLVYPVPTKDVLNIRWPQESDKPLKAEIKDLNGRLIYTTAAPAGSRDLQFNVHDLPAGVYFIEATTGNLMMQRKFIKQ